ncbi:MAG: (deoxy)nucleoside triphosphate pyrophosphohydrolase [Desulfobacterales bacterium]|jgi:8-oxo-dGTP diphosphatase|nr:(deoxy)nucleoside triphosphate pyrophosphohydrolase [Desulfobacterales bacterium]
MQHISVACAIIKENGKILVAQRSETMSMPLKWEFPGGKIDSGETPAQCLKREIMEELGIEVDVGRALPHVTHPYPDFSITLVPFLCAITGGRLILNEHKAIAWLSPEGLNVLDLAEADRRWLQQNPL